MAQRKGLVPTTGEDVKGDLSANGEGQSIVSEVVLECLYELGADIVLLVIGFESIALFNAVEAERVDRSWSATGMRSSHLAPYTHVAFLPMGEMLIMPFLNSMNVPRFFGMSRSAM